MLTLKIISTDVDGRLETNLFSAERISHAERDFNTKCISDDKFDKCVMEGDDFNYVIGGMLNQDTNQPLKYSKVRLYTKDDVEVILITPYSEVYIMQDGKTIDSFITRYYQEIPMMTEPMTK
jgi:hypothetical protein